MAILGFLFFAAIVVALIVWGQQQAAARRAELAALAAKRGWRFDDDDDGDFAEQHDRFALFDVGRSRRIFNTLRGPHAVRVGQLAIQAGDYRYTTGSGKHQRTHRLSYLMATLPVRLPADAHLVIRPEHFGDTLGAMVGFDDIDFESEEFSRRYFVKSNDRKFAYAVIHPRMMEYLLASPCGHLELSGAQLVLRGSSSEVWTAPEIEDAVNWLGTFIDLWPDFLISELRGRAG